MIIFIFSRTHAKTIERKQQYLHYTAEWLLTSWCRGRLQPVFKAMTHCEQWLMTERWSCSQEAECSEAGLQRPGRRKASSLPVGFVLLCLRRMCLGTRFAWAHALCFKLSLLCVCFYLLFVHKSTHKQKCARVQRVALAYTCVVCEHMNNSGMMIPVWNFRFKFFRAVYSFKNTWICAACFS